jgi:hypothetical protein
VSIKGIKLFQGYLWHPGDLAFDPKRAIPPQLGQDLADGPVHVLLDAIRPPMAFFDNGTPTEGHTFYQVTLLVRSPKDPIELKPITEPLSAELDPYLQATPAGVGWVLFEDLRQV